MSYSRWGSRGTGHWYTFWCAVGADGKAREETKDNALFVIFSVQSFTAKQLRDNMEKCIAIVESKDKTLKLKHTINPIAEKKDRLDELKIYMNEFLKDIDNKYS
jgi:hypothetical protein